MGSAVDGQVSAVAEEERFVNEALLPFLLRCRPIKQPTKLEVAALTWGYQASRGVSVSPLKVGRLLRKLISAKEQSNGCGLGRVEGLVEALCLAESAMPEVAASFWHPGTDDQRL